MKIQPIQCSKREKNKKNEKERTSLMGSFCILLPNMAIFLNNSHGFSFSFGLVLQVVNQLQLLDWYWLQSVHPQRHRVSKHTFFFIHRLKSHLKSHGTRNSKYTHDISNLRINENRKLYNNPLQLQSHVNLFPKL